MAGYFLVICGSIICEMTGEKGRKVKERRRERVTDLGKRLMAQWSTRSLTQDLIDSVISVVSLICSMV